MIENLTDGTKVFIHKRSFWSHALESNQSICMIRKIEAILGNFRQIKKEKKAKLSTTYSTATLPFSSSSMYVVSNSNSLRRSWLPSSSRWVHEEKGRVYGAEITLCTWFYYHLNDFFLTTEMFVLDKRDGGCKGVASKSVWHIWG